MSTARPHTLVIDFSVMPTRPDPSAAEDFVFKKVKLELKDTVVIQFHNVDRRFYIQMVDDEKPLQYQRAHNLQHKMLCAEHKREYRIPVYYLDGACTVRVHDLPPSLPNSTVKDFMQQYGTVVNIAFERWKNYFRGAYNGVRVLRMHLNKPIPSYLTIENNLTLCTHSPFGNKNQVKTCRWCNAPIHPNTKCGKEQQASTPVSSASKHSTHLDQSTTSSPASLLSESFPALEDTLKVTQTPHHSKAKEQEQTVKAQVTLPSTATPPPQESEQGMELDEHNGSEAPSEPDLLEQRRLYDVIMRSEKYLSFTDPEEKKKNAWIAAGSLVAAKRMQAEQNTKKK